MADLPTELSTGLVSGRLVGEFLKTALAGKAGIRVDKTVGTRVFLSDGTSEQLLQAETGRRRIESLLINGWTGTYLAIGRIGNVVHIFGTGINAAASTSRLAFKVPEGFRNNYFNAAKLPLSGAYADTAGMSPIAMSTIYSTGEFYIESSTAGSIIFSVSWPTRDPWPTVLPGTPA